MEKIIFRNYVKNEVSRKRKQNISKYSVGEELGGGILRGSVETPALSCQDMMRNEEKYVEIHVRI